MCKSCPRPYTHQKEDPEARIKTLLQREAAWHVAQLAQARQQPEPDTAGSTPLPTRSG
jgi:hypothetical protein